MRPVSRVSTGKESPTIVGRFVEPVSGSDRAREPVPNFFRTFALAPGNLVRMGADALLIVEDESSGALVDCGDAPRALDVLAAGALQLVDAVLKK